MTDPAAARHQRWGLVVLIVLALAIYNIVRSTAIPGDVHLSANVVMALLVLGLGFRARLTAGELGLARAQVRDGLRFGLAAMTVVAAALTVALIVPAARGFFDDDRVDVSLLAMLIRVGIVIPLGTVVVEEVIFRGVLHGLLRRRFEIGAASLIGAALFGLWHLFPVWRGYDGDDLGRAASVGGTFAATFVAGLVFIWLRNRSDSLLAPVLAHIATNSFPFAIAWVLA